MPLSEDDAVNSYDATVAKAYTAAKTNGYHIADTTGSSASTTNGSNAATYNGSSASATNGRNTTDISGPHTADTNGYHPSDTNGYHTANANGHDPESSQHTSRARYGETTNSQHANGASISRRPSASAVLDHDNLIPVVSSFNNQGNGFGTDDLQWRLPTGSQSEVDLIRRFLLDVFIYTYDPNKHVLEQAFLDCQPNSRPRHHINDRARFLSSEERHIITHYAEKVHQACTNLTQSNLSLLTRTKRDLIFRYIFQPARDLEIDPAYVCEQLLSYRTHRCLSDNRKKTRLYPKVSIWSRGRDLLGKKPQKLLACRLISDDITVSQLGHQGCEPLTELLGQCIQEFNHKYCKHGMANVDPDVYAGPLPTALAEELYWNQIVNHRFQEWNRGTDDIIFAPPFEEPSPPRPRSLRSSRSLSGVRPMSSIYEQDEQDERPNRPHSASGQRVRNSLCQMPAYAQSADFAIHPTEYEAVQRRSMPAPYASGSLGRRSFGYRG
jgi:hypothetical protein